MKKKIVLFMVLIIIIVSGGSMAFRMRGFNGKDIAIIWFLLLVGILALLDLIYLIIKPIIKMINKKEEDESWSEFGNRASRI